MRAEDLDPLLSSLLERDPDQNLDLELTEPVPWEGQPSLNTSEVDQLLQEAKHEGFLGGERGEGDGSISWWSGIRLTVKGLRRLGQWPPDGGEHLPGRWDEGVWGDVDRPLLLEFATNPPHDGFLFGPEGGDSAEERERWKAVMRLLSGRLIDGDVQQGGLDRVRITVKDHRALDGPATPLDRAVVELRRGAKAEAMTAVVDEALAELLRELARDHGLPIEQNGKPIRLNNLADQLKAAGVFGRDVHSEVEVCLALRNKTNHGQGAQISDTRIERAIGIVRELQAASH